MININEKDLRERFYLIDKRMDEITQNCTILPPNLPPELRAELYALETEYSRVYRALHTDFKG